MTLSTTGLILMATVSAFFSIILSQFLASGSENQRRILWKGQGIGEPGSHFPVIGDLKMAEGSHYFRFVFFEMKKKSEMCELECPVSPPPRVAILGSCGAWGGHFEGGGGEFDGHLS